MASLITQVKSKLFIPSAKKSMHALDGAYASLLHGRSLDFEDLRDYQYGDLVRDIDWRATARNGTPLVKRSRADRMHTLLFVVDTGLSMTALARDEQPKRELAVLATGALGYLGLRHGDDVALVHGDGHRITRRAPGRSEGALEHTLRTIDTAIRTAAAPSDREALLAFVTRTISRRMIVVIVTDDAPFTAETGRLLRLLQVQHEVLWITIDDAEPVLDHAAPAQRADVITRWAVPAFAHGDEEIVAEVRDETARRAAQRDELLDRMEISRATLGGQQDAVSALLHMMNRRMHVRS